MDHKTKRAVARELLHAADALDSISAVKKIRKRMTKSERKKMQREAKKRGKKMGRKIWVEVTQQPKKGKGGQYLGYATFHWQKDRDKKGHSVMINVGDKPAKLMVKTRDLMVKPKGGEPFVWGGGEDEEQDKKTAPKDEKKPKDDSKEKGGTRKAAELALAEKVFKSDVAKDAMKALKDGDSKPAEKIVKQLDDALGKGNAASKALQTKIDDAKKAAKKPKKAPKEKPAEDKGKEPPKEEKPKKPKDEPKKELTEADYAKSAPVKSALKMLSQGDKGGVQAAEDAAKEIDKRLGKGSDLAKELRKKAKLFETEEKFMKAAPVVNALKLLKKDKSATGVKLAQEVAEQVDARLGADNRVSKKLWEDIRKNMKNLKDYEDKVSKSAPVKNVEKMLKEGQKGAHQAAKDLLVALEKRIGPDAGLTQHIRDALDKSRSGASGQYEDYNSWKARLKEEGEWSVLRNAPKGA